MGLTRFYVQEFEGQVPAVGVADGAADVAEVVLPCGASRAPVDCDAAPAVMPQLCRLSEQESRHCAKVLRLREGDPIEVTDGKGALYAAVLQRVNDTCCEARIEAVLAFGGAPSPVRIVMAPTKQSERMEWFVEKATEMGVGGFGFVQTHRTERNKLSLERMEKIVVSAMKQSLQRFKPTLSPLCTWKEFIAQERGDMASSAAADTSAALAGVAAPAPTASPTASAPPLKFIAYCGEEYPRVELAHLLRGAAQNRLRPQGLTVLIGPEGDFTPEEVKQAVEVGYTPVLLGPTRLRAETAALYAACAAQLSQLETR